MQCAFTSANLDRAYIKQTSFCTSVGSNGRHDAFSTSRRFAQIGRRAQKVGQRLRGDSRVLHKTRANVSRCSRSVGRLLFNEQHSGRTLLLRLRIGRAVSPDTASSESKGNTRD